MAKGCIRTASGSKFDLINPDASMISIEDIAHHLAQVNRYNGAVPKPYSVAEHCVRGSKLLKNEYPQARLAFLLHDASEAYIKDMPRPHKDMMPGYEAYEETIHTMIMEHFGVLDYWKVYRPAIEYVDKNIMYHWEIRDFWNGPAEWSDVESHRAYRDVLDELPNEKIKPWNYKKAERKYLETFWRLMDEINDSNN